MLFVPTLKLESNPLKEWLELCSILTEPPVRSYASTSMLSARKNKYLDDALLLLGWKLYDSGVPNRAAVTHASSTTGTNAAPFERKRLLPRHASEDAVS